MKAILLFIRTFPSLLLSACLRPSNGMVIQGCTFKVLAMMKSPGLMGFSRLSSGATDNSWRTLTLMSVWNCARSWSRITAISPVESVISSMAVRLSCKLVSSIRISSPPVIVRWCSIFLRRRIRILHPWPACRSTGFRWEPVKRQCASHGVCLRFWISVRSVCVLLLMTAVDHLFRFAWFSTVETHSALQCVWPTLFWQFIVMEPANCFQSHDHTRRLPNNS
mmetsp:Transcript_18418/g.55254  ORF Transcript_18418/g.55254 Transcript_18418/m.55254 type:complete len:222 (+) Transcript_18418:690-1355(+)